MELVIVLGCWKYGYIHMDTYTCRKYRVHTHVGSMEYIHVEKVWSTYTCRKYGVLTHVQSKKEKKRKEYREKEGEQKQRKRKNI